MALEKATRDEWHRRIHESALRFSQAFDASRFRALDKLDVLQATVAEHDSRAHIPRLHVRTSAIASDEGLARVMDDLERMMRTPTYATLNLEQPRAVAYARRLLARDSLSENDHPDLDAGLIMDELAGDRICSFDDYARELPQYAGDIRDALVRLVGYDRFRTGLWHRRGFGDLLLASERLAHAEIASRDARRGTAGMDAQALLEMGFAALDEKIAERPSNECGDAAVFAVMDEMCVAAKKARLPYRVASHRLRGIPDAVYK